jgi:hypothetical protein
MNLVFTGSLVDYGASIFSPLATGQKDIDTITNFEVAHVRVLFVIFVTATGRNARSLFTIRKPVRVVKRVPVLIGSFLDVYRVCGIDASHGNADASAKKDIRIDRVADLMRLRKH